MITDSVFLFKCITTWIYESGVFYFPYLYCRK